MRKYIVILLLLIAFAVSMTNIAMAGISSFIDIAAMDTVTTSIQGDTWKDNRLRAYDNPPGYDLYGYMKFDVSSLSDDAVINSLVLTTRAEIAGWGDPVVDINYVTNDNWSRNSVTGHIGGVDALLSSGNTGFNTLSAHQAYNWTLDVTAHDWSGDLVDDYISLSMNQTAAGYRAIYWYGAGGDGTAPYDPTGVYAPVLRIGYEISEDGGDEDESGAPVPEPATMMLFGSGLLGLFLRRKI